MLVEVIIFGFFSLIFVNIAVITGIMRGLFRINLAGERGGGLHDTGTTDIKSGSISINTIKVL